MKTQPHVRLTAEQLKARYQAGHLTVKGYISLWLEAKRRKGWRLRTTVIAFCEELGISRGAFYKAISALKTEPGSTFNFAIHGEIEMWVDGDGDDSDLSTNGDNLSTNGDNLSTNGDNLSTIVENESLGSTTGEDYSAPTTLSQLSTTLSHLPTHPPEEREGTNASQRGSNSNTPTSLDPVQEEIPSAPGFALQQSRYKQEQRKQSTGDPFFGQIPMPWLIRGLDGKLTTHAEFLQWLTIKHQLPESRARMWCSNAQFKPEKHATLTIAWEEYQATLQPAQATGSQYQFVDLPNGARVGIQFNGSQPIEIQHSGTRFRVHLDSNGDPAIQEVA